MIQQISRETAQNIVETVKETCGRDINFIDTDGTIYASTDQERIGDFHEIGARAAATASTIEVDRFDSYAGTHPGVNIPVSFHHTICAVIGISGPPEEVRRYAMLALRITQLLLRENELFVSHRNRQSALHYMITGLLQHRHIHQEAFQEFVLENNLVPQEHYRTVVIQCSRRYNTANLGMLEAVLNESFSRLPHCVGTLNYPNEFLYLVPDASLKLSIEILRHLAEQYGELISIAIGSSASLQRQHRSYEDAHIALRALESRHVNAGLRFLIFDDLYLEILLGDISENANITYVRKTLSSLSEEEMQLLTVYYQNDMSLKAAAEQLYLHKNTIQYQMNRILEKTGLNPRSFHDAVQLYLALRLRDFHAEKR